MIQRTPTAAVVGVVLFMGCLGAEEPPIKGCTVIAATGDRGKVEAAANALDGKRGTEMTVQGEGNGTVTVTIDLGANYRVSAVRITNGAAKSAFFVSEVLIGPAATHLRPMLGRSVNILRGEGLTTTVPLRPAVGRVVELRVFASETAVGIDEIEILGTTNRPERHLLCWASDVTGDYADKLDYFDKDLGATDLWIWGIATAFPNTIGNTGFEPWVKSGVLGRLKDRGINYWLEDHEAFTNMVRSPDDLRDELAWQTTLALMEGIYPKAAELGFRGLVFDAENYYPCRPDVVKERAEALGGEAHVTSWSFAEEFGAAGLYYRRGLEVGKRVRNAWGDSATLIQYYEAAMYAAVAGSRDGNWWWLKGIHDSGVEIWIALEKTYSAGKHEIPTNSASADWLYSWFVDMNDCLPSIHRKYSFAGRVLPGFHPWNTRLREPMYLPKYLDQQLALAASLTDAYWIYNEGNRRGGDPRDVLDREFCAKHGLQPEDFLQVFARHPTPRSGPTR